MTVVDNNIKPNKPPALNMLQNSLSVAFQAQTLRKKNK